MYYYFLILWAFVNSKNITNIDNLYDTDGNVMVTGELGIMFHNQTYYITMNNWGGCKNSGCNSPCVYSGNHTVSLYSTPDFESFTNHGTILSASQRPAGIEFRPHMVYNSHSKLFVLWWVSRPYPPPPVIGVLILVGLVIWVLGILVFWKFGSRKVERWDVGLAFFGILILVTGFGFWLSQRPRTGGKWFAVATSPNPTGPFTMVTDRVKLQADCTNGADYTLYVDEEDPEKPAYVVWSSYLTHDKICVEKLDKTYTRGEGKGELSYTTFNPPSQSEAPVMFFHQGSYYLFLGKCCCACSWGANLYYYTSDTLLGEYVFRGDVGTGPDGNYTTKSQLTTVFPIANNSWVLVGNNWGSDDKWHAYNRDHLYFYPLEIAESGNVSQVEWKDFVEFEV